MYYLFSKALFSINDHVESLCYLQGQDSLKIDSVPQDAESHLDENVELQKLY